MFLCFCCGSEVTSPQFHKGHVYGWSCIKKVSDQSRVNLGKSKYTKADSVDIKDLGRGWMDQTAVINGVEYAASSMVQIMDSSTCLVQIIDHNGKPTLKGVRQAQDENGYICGVYVDKNKNRIEFI